MTEPAASGTDASGGPDLRQIAAALGPFAPPEEFDHGDAFDRAAPRPLPDSVRRSSYTRRRRGVLYTLVALGIMFIVFAPLPFVKELSFYILPLAWLHWIGWGLIGIAALRWLWGMIDPGRYRYIREGVPIAGRVLTVERVATGTVESPQFQFVAAVEFVHPETGKQEIAAIAAEDSWTIGQAARHTCTAEPGDYVTLVYLPGTLEKTLRIYGFLGLDPEQELLLKDGRPLRGMSPFTALMIAFVIGVGVLILMGLFDLMMFSFPIGGGWKLPLAIAGGGALLGAVVAWGAHNVRSSQNESSSPFGALLGGAFLGLIGAPLLFMILNAQLDTSALKLEPIEVVNFWQTTHNFVIRDYEIEYRPLHGGATHKRHIRHSQIRRMEGVEQAVMDVGEGRFGYPWIRGFYRVSWADPADVPNVDGPVYQFTVRDESAWPDAAPITLRVVPVIDVAEDWYAPVPPIMIERAVQELRTLFPDLAPVEGEEMPTKGGAERL